MLVRLLALLLGVLVLSGGDAVPFNNDVVGGTTLVRPSIHSPNYVAGVSGWSINYDGSAEFNNVVVRGAFEVDGVPQRRVKIYTDALGFPVIEFRDAAGGLYTMVAFDGVSALSIFAGTTNTEISELAFETSGRIRFSGATYGVVYVGKLGDSIGYLTTDLPGGITESWHGLAYSNGWSDFGAPYNSGAYRLTAIGMVQLRGLIKGGTGADGTIIATLPNPYRPLGQVIISVGGGTPNKSNGILITTGGDVKIYGVAAAPGDGVSLESCSFPVI